MELKLLKPMKCPFCDEVIYTVDQRGKPVELNDKGILFWVKFNDSAIANFSICKNCLPILDREKINLLMSYQIYTWGHEIIDTPLGIVDLAQQLKWYVNTAVHLKIDMWGKTKDEVQSKPD